LSYIVPECCMKDKIVLITGSTDGIGRQTALELACRGAHVILHGRNPERGKAAQEAIGAASGNPQVDLLLADLSSQRQIRHLADEIHEGYDHLDVLINNAGVNTTERTLTEDGLEMTFAVNYLAPFLLTYLLLDLLKKSAPSRIITVSSKAHMRTTLDFDNLQSEKNFNGSHAYALSKLGNILFTFELAGQLSGSGVTVNCLHPGVIDTKMMRLGFSYPHGADVEKGAETPVYLATSPEVANVTGQYFEDKRPAPTSPLSHDIALRKKFWAVSEQLCGIK